MRQISEAIRFDFGRDSVPESGTLQYLREAYAIAIPELIAGNVSVKLTIVSKHRDVKINVHGEKITPTLHNFISITAVVNSRQQTEDILSFSLNDDCHFPIDTILVECSPTDHTASIIVSVWEEV